MTTGRAGAAALAASVALALALAAGCAPRGERPDDRAAAGDPAGDSAASVAAGQRVLERTRGAPDDTVAGYARYFVEWPGPEAVPDSHPLADSLAAAVAWAVAEGQAGADGRPLPADSLAARFLAEHAQLMRDFPGGPREWHIERHITLETLPSGVATLRIDDERYEGGAHGMSTTTYRSFDPRDGSHIALADLADEAGREGLRRLGERAFRVARDIPPGHDLKAAGYFVWDGGDFALSGNFGATRDGLVFHWNPYDIAPYVVGATTITLPWAAVRKYLRPGGPLTPSA